MKNIVFFGGGTGLSTLLRGIKEIDGIHIQAIVTVADSGGSTGLIRKEFNIPALGDIRQVMLSLSQKENILQKLTEYRFNPKNKENSSLSKHSLGNLIIYALIDLNNDFYQGIYHLSKIFNLKGEVIPVTDYPNAQLIARYEDGTEQIGEHLIPSLGKKIEFISHMETDKIVVNPRAIQAINEADIIVFSCGSLYTSIIANLSLPAIKNALLENDEKKFIYFSNIVTQPNETMGFDALDHVAEIEKYLKYGIIDIVVMNDTKPSDKLIEKYKETKSDLILPNERIMNSHCEVIGCSLIDNSNQDNIRHDAKKIKKAFKKILGEE
ncbi:MAG: gluconeogenesis factor YvcK family protein [Mycoplasma sp.]